MLFILFFDQSIWDIGWNNFESSGVFKFSSLNLTPLELWTLLSSGIHIMYHLELTEYQENIHFSRFVSSFLIQSFLLWNLEWTSFPRSFGCGGIKDCTLKFSYIFQTLCWKQQYLANQVNIRIFIEIDNSKFGRPSEGEARPRRVDGRYKATHSTSATELGWSLSGFCLFVNKIRKQWKSSKNQQWTRLQCNFICCLFACLPVCSPVRLLPPQMCY